MGAATTPPPARKLLSALDAAEEPHDVVLQRTHREGRRGDWRLRTNTGSHHQGRLVRVDSADQGVGEGAG